ncbi:MAG: glutamyl-tRNA reductase [Acidobacteriota bacterium]|nr:MAG: glutamyl-tRNA reductase [Acidobacteriota bacterium]
MTERIVLVGLNHRTAPVEVRESVHVTQEMLPKVLSEIRTLDGLRGATILSTCNRTEVTATFASSETHPDTSKAGQALEAFMARSRGVPEETLRAHLYHHFDLEAVRHVFRVASSLDAMILGEPQILGQVKEAFEAARQAGATPGLLGRTFERAFRVAKRVRTETAVGDGAVSVGYAAVELARKIFDDLSRQRVLIIGSGEMAETIVENLKSHGSLSIVVSNRHYDRAVALAARHGGTTVRYDALAEAVDDADIILSATACPAHVLSREHVEELRHRRRSKPLFLIDIAVPRDIDPSLNELEGIFLYNIDDLAGVVEENRAWREAEACKAERIVDEEVLKFARTLETLEVDPLVRALTEKAEKIRLEEWEKTFRRLRGLGDEEREAVQRMTQALLKKLLSGPIVTLKQAAQNGEGHELADALQKMFRLPED